MASILADTDVDAENKIMNKKVKNSYHHGTIPF